MKFILIPSVVVLLLVNSLEVQAVSNLTAIYSHQNLVEVEQTLPSLLPSLPLLQERLRCLIEVTEAVIIPKSYPTLSKSEVDVLVELLSLIQDLQGKLPTNSSVQNAHAELIAEIQRSMRSSSIFAIENLQDLLAALPDVLPAFPVLQKKLKVLVEASLFVVDKTATTTTTKAPAVTARPPAPALSSSDRSVITQMLGVLQDVKGRLPQTSSVQGAYADLVSEIQKILA